MNMKTLKKSVFCILSALAVSILPSCSDKIYEEINTDPTKADHINPASQLTYAELQLFGDMNYVDVYRLYTYAFTQHLMGCWNTTNYGGQHRVDDNEMSRPWNNLYAGAMRNLTDGIAATKDDPEQVNLNAALRIMRVWKVLRSLNTTRRRNSTSCSSPNCVRLPVVSTSTPTPFPATPCLAATWMLGVRLPTRCACAMQCVYRMYCPTWQRRNS